MEIPGNEVKASVGPWLLICISTCVDRMAGRGGWRRPRAAGGILPGVGEGEGERVMNGDFSAGSDAKFS